MITKAEKNGVCKVFSELRKLPRYNLSWEWMHETKDGEYVKFSDMYQTIIEFLHRDNTRTDIT